MYSQKTNKLNIYYNTAYIQTLIFKHLTSLCLVAKTGSMPWPYLTRIHSSSHGSLFQTSNHMHYTLHSLWHNKYTLKNIHINIIKRIYTLKIIYILDFQKENVLVFFYQYSLHKTPPKKLLFRLLSRIAITGQGTHLCTLVYCLHHPQPWQLHGMETLSALLGWGLQSQFSPFR